MKMQLAWFAVLASLAASPLGAAISAPSPPDLADVAYGPHARHTLDLWKASSPRPTPLIVFFHGGGFRQGSKAQVPASFVEGARRAGLSIASANYRLSHTATFPAPMEDGARAIQFLRSRAEEWNLDPKRFAAVGTSAGAGISLWVAFHDDLARPDRADPVERQSSRVVCVGTFGGQASYDPRFIRRHIGGSAISHSALLAFYGLRAEEFDTPRAHALFEAASPINSLSADDPPVFSYYNPGPPVPLAAEANENDVIHHAQFGVVLTERMRALGIHAQTEVLDVPPGRARRDEVYGRILANLRECLAAR